MGLILGCLKDFSLCVWSIGLLFWRRECAAAPPEASPQARLLPLHPIPAADLLPLQLAAHVRRDPQLGGSPEAVHFSGEVFGELGRVNGEQGLVVGVGSRR